MCSTKHADREVERSRIHEVQEVGIEPPRQTRQQSREDEDRQPDAGRVDAHGLGHRGCATA